MSSNLSETFLNEALKTDESIDKASLIISKEISANTYDISKFVESLGFALTSPTVDLRVKGTKFLSTTLNNLSQDFLNETQITFLTTFYCDRLKDHHNVIPAIIDGISALIAMKNISRDCPVQFLNSFFQNTTCQSQVRGDREKIFKILKNLSENYVHELTQLGGDFIYSMINAIDGERDPRNLDFIFTFMPDFVKTFPLLHLAEEMFEIFACYFPIDFNPSKSDPSFITRDDLANKLANCLVASEEFVEWTISLSLEKLESDLIIAKLDSLNLLTKSAESFPPKTIEPLFDQIWPALKSELLPGSDNIEIIATGLKSLRTLLEKASSIDKEISKNYQTIILGNILPHLNDANHRLFNPSSSLALACVSGDPQFASEKILNSFLITLQGNKSSNDQKLKIFAITAQIFKIATFKRALVELDGPVLQQLHGELIELLKTEKNIEITKAILICFQECVELIKDETRAILYQILFKMLTNENINIDLSEFLHILATKHAEELKTKCIEICLRNFPLIPISVKEKIYKNFSILIQHDAFESLILNLIFSNIFGESPSEQRTLALVALREILQKVDVQFIERLQREYEIIDRIFVLVKKSQLSYEILENCATILSLIVRNLTQEDQKIIIEKYLPKMNLQLSSDLFLTKGLLGFMHKDVNVDDHFEQLLTDLTNLSLTSDDETVRLVCHHLLCSLLNKMDDNDANRNALEKILQKIRDEIKKENKKAVEILSWIAKGLSVRGFSTAGEIIESIADLLDHPSLASAASLAFEIISVEYPQLYLPAIKFLYKQKLFHIVLNKIWNKLETFSEHHLNAFIYVLKSTPHPILRMNIEKIGPILFKCLDLNSTNTLKISLEICENFVKDKDEYFRSHLNHLVPQCLKLTQYDNSMQVRIKSLNLLEDITKYPTFVLLPYKMDVVLGLYPVLDDKKRFVRNAAVKARNEWFLIGSATGE